MKYKIVIYNEQLEHIAIYYVNTENQARKLYDNIFIRGDYFIQLIRISDNCIIATR